MLFQTTLTYVSIIILLNLVAFYIYSYSPAKSIKHLSRPIFYFRSFFIVIAIGFVVFGLGLPKLTAFHTVVTNTCFLVAFFCLYFGFKSRKYPQTDLLRYNKVFYFNWLFLIVFNVIAFTIYIDLHLLRSAIITCNCSLIAVFTLKHISLTDDKLEYGEKIAYSGIVVSMICAMSLILVLSFTNDVTIYLSLLVISQSVIALLLLGGTQAMFLSDLSKLYYEESITDELTGLTNRRYFLRQTELLIKSAERHKFPLTLVLCDIDRFKHINDTYGHDVGDLALIEFSGILKRCCREEDIASRFGGEEFIFLLPQTDIEGGRALAERVKMLTEQHQLSLEGASVNFTASFGVASINGKGDISTYIKQVDQAMYDAKASGRNQVVIYCNNEIEA